jgi:hypothetical protein
MSGDLNDDDPSMVYADLAALQPQVTELSLPAPPFRASTADELAGFIARCRKAGVDLRPQDR